MNITQNQEPDGPTALQTYLDANKFTAHGWALANGIDPSTVNKLLNGKQGASLELAVRIEDATGGEVPARLWVKRRAP